MRDAVDRLAGVRLLRDLGPGRRCRLMLGHQPEADGPGRLLVLKQLPDPDAVGRAGRELLALERAAGEHVVAAVDLSSSDDTTVLLLEYLSGPSLSGMLAARSRWAAGEVVTILAPVARTLMRMHAAGIAHGALDAGHIVFDRLGSPTLVGFGSAEIFEQGLPPVRLAARPGVAHDRESIRELACLLLGLVAEPFTAAATALADEIAELDEELVLSTCWEAAFRLAPAEAVRVEPLAHGVAGESSAVPLRALLVEAGPALDLAPTPMPAPATGLLAGLLPDEWGRKLAELLPPLLRRRGKHAAPVETATTTAHPAADDARPPRSLRSILSERRPLLIGAVAAGVSLVIGLGLPGSEGTVDLADADPGESGLVDSGIVAGSQDGMVDETAAPHAVDDPLAAAAALADARARCFDDLSVLCLEHIHESGSPALSRDRRSIDAARTGIGQQEQPVVLPTQRVDYELVEELGGSALVRTIGADSATTLLLIRSGGVWRIREILPAAENIGAAP